MIIRMTMALIQEKRILLPELLLHLLWLANGMRTRWLHLSCYITIIMIKVTFCHRWAPAAAAVYLRLSRQVQSMSSGFGGNRWGRWEWSGVEQKFLWMAGGFGWLHLSKFDSLQKPFDLLDKLCSGIAKAAAANAIQFEFLLLLVKIKYLNKWSEVTFWTWSDLTMHARVFKSEKSWSVGTSFYYIEINKDVHF